MTETLPAALGFEILRLSETRAVAMADAARAGGDEIPAKLRAAGQLIEICEAMEALTSGDAVRMIRALAHLRALNPSD